MKFTDETAEIKNLRTCQGRMSTFYFSNSSLKSAPTKVHLLGLGINHENNIFTANVSVIQNIAHLDENVANFSKNYLELFQWKEIIPLFCALFTEHSLPI